MKAQLHPPFFRRVISEERALDARMASARPETEEKLVFDDRRSRDKERMRAARQQLDASLNEFNRVVTALQVAKETLAKKRTAACAAKSRVRLH